MDDIKENEDINSNETSLNELELKTKECEDLKNQLLLERAKLLNYSKDEKERFEMIVHMKEKTFLNDLINVLDNFDISLKNIEDIEANKGITILYNQIVALLNHYNCFSFTSLDSIFDPSLHEAIEIVKDDTKAEGTIIEEFQKGYKYNNQVLRPAKVKVVKNI